MTRVSVLFSEPKIPQFFGSDAIRAAAASFSALQRAENSSIYVSQAAVAPPFSFSALQRAENSSI